MIITIYVLGVEIGSSVAKIAFHWSQKIVVILTIKISSLYPDICGGHMFPLFKRIG